MISLNVRISADLLRAELIARFCLLLCAAQQPLVTRQADLSHKLFHVELPVEDIALGHQQNRRRVQWEEIVPFRVNAGLNSQRGRFLPRHGFFVCGEVVEVGWRPDRRASEIGQPQLVDFLWSRVDTKQIGPDHEK